MKTETYPYEPSLSLLSVRMYSALKNLTRERKPHPCGGFNTDDMQWRMGTAFTSEDDMYEALDDLVKAQLIRFSGYDEESAIECCYELRRDRQPTSAGSS